MNTENQEQKQVVWGTRKILTLTAMGLIAFIVVYCILTRLDIPEGLAVIVTSLLNYIGWYYAKSTALDVPKTNKEEK